MCIDSFRVAGKPDAPAIAKLVNKAYRPHPAESGWTHESGLISGNRTSIGQAVALIFELGSAVLVGLKESRIVACVHVKKDGGQTRIGMLAVNPLLQGLGAGKQMLAHAERYANSNFFPEKFVMAVISARNELISFYLRRGYKKQASRRTIRSQQVRVLLNIPASKSRYLKSRPTLWTKSSLNVPYWICKYQQIHAH